MAWTPGWRSGDVVVAERVVQCDAGMIEDERLLVYQAGHVAFFNATDRLGYDADAGLLNRVRDRLAGIRPAADVAGRRGTGPAAAHRLWDGPDR